MSEAVVQKGKVVQITYSILDQEGQVLEQMDLPVSYVHGAQGPLIEKIEQSLEGRGIGERVRVTLSPQEGFGPHRPELTYTDDVDNVPPQYRHLGAEVMFENDRGETMTMRVSRIDGGRLTVDGNHPLAGKTLTFVVHIVSLRDATLDELATGTPAESAPPTLH